MAISNVYHGRPNHQPFPPSSLLQIQILFRPLSDCGDALSPDGGTEPVSPKPTIEILLPCQWLDQEQAETISGQ